MTTILPARAPFDFSWSLRFLCGFLPTEREQQVDQDSLTKVLRVGGVNHTVTARAHQGGVALEGGDEKVGARVRQMLALDDDLTEFYALAEQDPVMRPVIEKLNGLHQVRFATPYEAAVWFILSQRCAISQARAMKQKLSTAFGAGAFPEPPDLWRTSLEKVTQVLGHSVKAARVWSVTEAFLDADERFLREGPFEAVRDWLLQIDGIGPWSAAAVMLRGIGRTDSLEGAEEQLEQVVKRAYGAKTKFSTLAARYGRHQGYWAYYLKSFDAGLPMRAR